MNRRDNQAVIHVRDNGLGIPKEMLANVFDMFTQIDKHLDHAQGGLGIGLTLVRSLVEMHGGTVVAHSAGLGQGSEFVVSLPLLKEEPARRSGAAAAGAGQEAAAAGKYCASWSSMTTRIPPIVWPAGASPGARRAHGL